MNAKQPDPGKLESYLVVSVAFVLFPLIYGIASLYDRIRGKNRVPLPN